MNYQEVLELVRAGYTKAEIEKMISKGVFLRQDAVNLSNDGRDISDGNIEGQGSDCVSAAGLGGQEGELVNKDLTETMIEDRDKYKQKFEDLYNSINDLRLKLISQNIAQTNVPSKPAESVRDIMANIISPSKGENNG